MWPVLGLGLTADGCRSVVVWSILPVVAIVASVVAMPVMGQVPDSSVEAVRPAAAQFINKIVTPFAVAAVGDIIAPQPFDNKDPSYTALVARIRSADVGFANMESSLVDLESFTGGNAGSVAPLAMGDSIRALGVTMMNHANNHTFDGGVEGMISTDYALDRLGIVHAGTGPNLEVARAAAFAQTPKGRVALVGAFAMTDIGMFGPNYAKTEASARLGQVGGAPGVTPLHLTAYQAVAPAQLASLRQLAREAYGERRGAFLSAHDGAPERFRYYDQWFEASSAPGTIHFDMDPRDEAAYLASVRSGKFQSDFLIATIHSHQTPHFCGNCAFGQVKGVKEGLEHQPPDYLVSLAHRAIDAGADMFVTHGVHALAGIEIYKGAPIFYGLSNFVFQFPLQWGEGTDALATYRKREELDNPASLESVLAVSRFSGGQLIAVDLYPVELGEAGRPLSQLGIPHHARPEAARRILTQLQGWSAPFGTVIDMMGDYGTIRVLADRSR